MNLLDSGDAPVYWMRQQRGPWRDPLQGKVPIGWCLAPLLYDLMPDVLDWYYKRATEMDEFFCGVSGVAYISAVDYATRLHDPEEAWRRFTALTRAYCEALDLNIIELYMGPPQLTTQRADVLWRYILGIPHLNALLAGLGRHWEIEGDKMAQLMQWIPVFWTATDLHVWQTSAEVVSRGKREVVDWLVAEIRRRTPASRPAFMSAMPVSWTFNASLIRQVVDALGPDYVAVTPGQLADLYLQHQGVAPVH